MKVNEVSGSRSVISANVLALACAGLLANQALANNWVTTGSGLWTDPANWSPAVPDGVDAVADFSTVDLANDATVNLGSAHTVGTLKFDDLDPSTAGGWLLSDGAVPASQQTLTLATSSGPATINVGNLGTGKVATIDSLLNVASTQTVVKTGVGTLVLTNTGNAASVNPTFLGVLDIQQGTFQVASTFALPNFASNTVLIDGGTMRFSQSANTTRIFSLGTGGGTLAAASATNFSGTTAMPLVGAGARTFTFNAETAGSYGFSNIIGDGSGGATSFVKAGPGALTISNSNTFTGTIAVNGGTLSTNFLGGTPTGTPATATTYTGGGVTIASGATMIVTRGLALNFAGPVTGGGNLTIKTTNDGLISLGNGSFTGTTTIQRGLYNLSNSPGTSNYVLGNTAVSEYAVINLDNGNFTGPLGTTGGGVSFAGSGGFSNPNAGTRIVSLGGLGTPTALQLNVGGFVAGNGTTGTTTDFRLKLGDVAATALGSVDFQNPIDVNGRRLTVTVDGLAQFPGVLSGNLTGTAGTTGGLSKFGNASLLLTGNNIYSGATVIVGGNAPTFASAIVLGSAGAFSPNTNIQLTGGTSGLAGGVLGLGFADGNFTLGTGNGQVQFAAANSGGFGAYGAARTVTLNSGATLKWANTPNFLAASQNLILALQNGDATLTFNNPIDVNGSNRGIVVNDGSAAVDAVISQPISNSSGTAAGINKLGTGTLALTAVNTYSGVTTVTAGKLVLSGSGTFGGGTVNDNAAVEFANTGALAVPNVVGGTGTVIQSGSGTTTFSGANTYSGVTTIIGGTLKATVGAGATGAGNNLLSNAGGVDLGNNGGKLLLDYTGVASPVGTVKAILDAEYNSTGAGSANFALATSKLRSSTLGANRTIGYGDNGTDTVSIRVTLAGDANLDGAVDFNDFLVLQNNFNAAGTRFDQGNFNYDGSTDFNDFLVLQNNFGQSITGVPVAISASQVAALRAFAADPANTSVPEPTAFAALSLGGMILARRRRR